MAIQRLEVCLEVQSVQINLPADHIERNHDKLWLTMRPVRGSAVELIEAKRYSWHGTGHHVTWILDDKWNTFHGLYHDDMVDAVADYEVLSIALQSG